MSEVQFNEEHHIYTCDGEFYPSVTQIINHFFPSDFSFVSDEDMAFACYKGTEFHRLTELIDKGESLDDEIYDEELFDPMLEQYRKFLSEHEVKWEAIEKRFCKKSKYYKFAGTIDRVGYVDGKMCILDIKTGKYKKTHDLQLDGYAFGIKAVLDIQTNDNFYVLEVTDKKYKLRKIEHCGIFRDLATIYHWGVEKGLIK